jgi:hypothetical protein
VVAIVGVPRVVVPAESTPVPTNDDERLVVVAEVIVAFVAKRLLKVAVSAVRIDV